MLVAALFSATMLGLEGYASDSDDDNVDLSNPPVAAPSKSGLNLPPPSSSSSKGLSLPPPKVKKAVVPKKVIVALPKLEKHASDEEDESRPVKRARTTGRGSGASALLGMLPAPKKTAIEAPPPQRVLGGGRPGIVYTSAPAQSSEQEQTEGDVGEDLIVQEETTRTMLPPSLLKGKSKAVTKPDNSKEENGLDLFSLNSSLLRPTVPSVSSSILSEFSAAPKVEEFRPPSPTVKDPYPGYYQLPSGAWAMHDPDYYKIYTDRWAKEYEAQIRAYEKEQGTVRGFEGANDSTTTVNADEQLDQARKEREEKKAITRGAALDGERTMPNMKINPQKAGGLARTRHQLSTLLTDAYMNREALEEKIAVAKRNRKEAGNKYGF